MQEVDQPVQLYSTTLKSYHPMPMAKFQRKNVSYTPTPINYHGREGYKEGQKNYHSKKKKKGKNVSHPIKQL